MNPDDIDLSERDYSVQELYERLVKGFQSGQFGGSGSGPDDIDIDADKYSEQELLTRLIKGFQSGQFN